MDGIDERLTRVGPRRIQGWTIFLDGQEIAYYDRDPIRFVQTFQVVVSEYGSNLGFNSVDTEDPYHEMCRQLKQLNCQDRQEITYDRAGIYFDYD